VTFSCTVLRRAGQGCHSVLYQSGLQQADSVRLSDSVRPRAVIQNVFTTDRFRLRAVAERLQWSVRLPNG
jgi:hypothetical protein